MDKLYRDENHRLKNGFTLTETLFVLLIGAVSLAVFCGSVRPSVSLLGKNIVRILETEQALALRQRKTRKIRIDTDKLNCEQTVLSFPAGIACEPASFSFNEKGNISRAGTIRCSDPNRSIRIVLQLGTGRMRIENEKI